MFGNVDCGEILINGTGEMVRKNVKELIIKVAPGGGYVLASTQRYTGLCTPFENFQACRDYGNYVIQV